jgi:hypothetical protein
LCNVTSSAITIWKNVKPGINDAYSRLKGLKIGGIVWKGNN